jgi:hypothetical protein
VEPLYRRRYWLRQPERTELQWRWLLHGGSTGGFACQGNVGVSYRVSDRGQAFVETGYPGSTSGNIS